MGFRGFLDSYVRTPGEDLHKVSSCFIGDLVKFPKFAWQLEKHNLDVS